MDNLTGGTTSWLLCGDRSRYLDDLWFTGIRSLERYSGAVPWRDRVVQFKFSEQNVQKEIIVYMTKAIFIL